MTVHDVGVHDGQSVHRLGLPRRPRPRAAGCGTTARPGRRRPGSWPPSPTPGPRPRPAHRPPRRQAGQHHPHRRPRAGAGGLRPRPRRGAGGRRREGPRLRHAVVHVAGAGAGTAHRIDGRTDIYSLGVVLYEMLTGRVPFRATTIPELLRQVRDDEPQPPRQLVRDIPPELERVCLKALAKRQQDRYTTAADFAEDLRACCRQQRRASRQPPIETPAEATSAAAPTPPPVRTPTPTSSSPAPRPRGRAPPGDRPGLRLRPVRVRGVPGTRRGGPGQRAAGLPAGLRSRRCGQFDGTVVQCNEQGLLACFGYPVAYEDAARRAARAGLGSSTTKAWRAAPRGDTSWS